MPLRNAHVAATRRLCAAECETFVLQSRLLKSAAVPYWCREEGAHTLRCAKPRRRGYTGRGSGIESLQCVISGRAMFMSARRSLGYRVLADINDELLIRLVSYCDLLFFESRKLLIELGQFLLTVDVHVSQS